MSENSKIEWTDHTFNPWIGCTKVGPGCDNCYAKADFDDRKHRVVWGAGQARSRTAPANWKKPLQWDKEREAFFAQHGRRQRVFCASLADVFDNEVPAEWRHDLFRLILDTPHLDWLLLTKRIGNVPKMLAADQWEHLGNVWLGATVVNQEEADRDIPKLLATPARVRFLSMEPLLGPVNLRQSQVWKCCGHPLEVADGDGWTSPRYGYECCQDPDIAIDWVIVGGESGPNARPMHPDWARSLRDQCAAAGVPFLFKQWGEWNPGTVYEAVHAKESVRIEPSGTVHPWPPLFDPGNGDWCMHKVGKKPAGRLLDGVEHNEFPKGA